MTTVELKLSLPDQLAEQATKADLLTPEAIKKLLQEAVRKQAVAELFEALDEIEALKLPAMSEAEIQAEIDAVRAERLARENAARC